MTRVCSQCGISYEARACGPTHAVIQASVLAIQQVLGCGSTDGTYNQIRRSGADLDDVAIVEAAQLMAAGRRTEFVITLHEGYIVAVAARDGGPA